MSCSIRKLTIKGFRSIHELDEFELGALNVLIGANGAGKSNLVSFFDMLQALANQRLQSWIQDNGGSEAQLFFGAKVTPRLEARLDFDPNAYQLALKPGGKKRHRLYFEREVAYFSGQYASNIPRALGTGHEESKLKDEAKREARNGHKAIAWHVHDAVRSWTVYHFHDTSHTAGVRGEHSARQTEALFPDAANLAPFLRSLQNDEAEVYSRIVQTVAMVAPFFDDFVFRESGSDTEPRTALEWRQKGSPYIFGPGQLSDGTLRFICLTTALLQPALPSTMILDEPELGLHPYGLALMAELIKQAAKRTQLIVATQSSALIDRFQPEDVIVVERTEGQSTFRRLKKAKLRHWLDEYSLGELWEKNVVEAGPRHENGRRRR